MAVMSTPNYRGRLLDVGRFLLLQGQYNKISAPPLPSGSSMSGMELLLDQRHHGKVFIKGIFVAEASTYKAFGINYTGKLLPSIVRNQLCSFAHIASDEAKDVLWPSIALYCAAGAIFSLFGAWAVIATLSMNDTWSWASLR